MNTSNLCEMAKLLADSKLISIAHFVQIIISIFCLLSIAINLPLKCLKYQPVALHKNLKIIIFNAAFFYVLNSISIIALQLNHQIKFHTYSDPCDLLIEFWKCIIIKDGNALSIVGFTLIHVIICFERSMAVLYPAIYEASSSIIGIITTILMWAIIMGWHIWMFIGEDLSSEIAYCTLTTPTNAYKWLIEFPALMAIDLIVLTIDILITNINKKLLKRHKINPILTQNFLGNAYQLNENARAMSIILPTSFAHSAIFLLFLSFTIISRIFFQNGDPIIFKFCIECSNTILAIYTVLIPLVYFRLKKNLKPKLPKIILKDIPEFGFLEISNGINTIQQITNRTVLNEIYVFNGSQAIVSFGNGNVVTQGVLIQYEAQHYPSIEKGDPNYKRSVILIVVSASLVTILIMTFVVSCYIYQERKRNKRLDFIIDVIKIQKHLSPEEVEGLKEKRDEFTIPKKKLRIHYESLSDMVLALPFTMAFSMDNRH